MPRGLPRITHITRNQRFEKNYRSLSIDLQAATRDAIRDLFKTPVPASRRLHSLRGFKNPKIFTIDVLSNHSYKISFEINGEVANLRRVASHRTIDSAP